MQKKHESIPEVAFRAQGFLSVICPKARIQVFGFWVRGFRLAPTTRFTCQPKVSNLQEERALHRLVQCTDRVDGVLHRNRHPINRLHTETLIKAYKNSGTLKSCLLNHLTKSANPKHIISTKQAWFSKTSKKTLHHLQQNSFSKELTTHIGTSKFYSTTCRAKTLKTVQKLSINTSGRRQPSA